MGFHTALKLSRLKLPIAPSDEGSFDSHRLISEFDSLMFCEKQR